MQAQPSEEHELNEEAQRIYEHLKGAFDDELRGLAQRMASQEDHRLLGETEFEVRDAVHRLGARVLETAANERQKKGRLPGS